MTQTPQNTPGDSGIELLALRKQTDARNFSQSLSTLAALLGDGSAAPAAHSGSGNLLAQTLTQVLHQGGVKVSLKAVDSSLDAFDALQLLARQAHVTLRQVKAVGQNWYRQDSGPLLAFLKATGQPVALLPIASGGYRVHDVSTGRSVPLDAAAAALLDERAWMFFRKFEAKVIGLMDLLRFGLVGARYDALTMLGCGILGGLLGLCTPYATGLLIDKVIPSARTDELMQLVLLLVTATVGIAAFELMRSLSLLRIEGRLGNATEAAVMDRLINLPAPFFRDYAAGDLAQRAFSINSILHLLTSTTQSAVLTWIFGLFSFGYMFSINMQLALIGTALVAVIVLVTVSGNLLCLRLQRQMYDIQGKLASRVLQYLNGIGKLRSGGAENRAFVLWARDFAQQKQLDMTTRSIGNALGVFNSIFTVVASGVLFTTIAFYQKDISTGVFLTFNTAFMQFLMATLGLAGALTGSLSVIPLYERAKPILSALPEQHESQVQAGKLQGDIEISHASFRYTEDGPLVLDDVSIHIQPGEFVAFVGASGSGKSTLFRLLLGFEKPQSGAVYFDDQDLASLDAGSVRRQLGVVLQNGKLMPGDIFTNIVGSSPRTQDDAWQAARMAGLEDDIRAMPMGMHTVISEGASTISGGQRQRLMVARALVNRPSVLLFDEATSALDNKTQATVAASIKALDATRIVIAHRLSTIIDADRIFVIDAGKVVESGNYDSLMALDGHFAQLSKRQQL